MAMDKERLLAYFQEQYLSRQEALFKLPLNYSIDTFWPELLNRRKAKASLLPLYNASGMPYWYVLTKKMIAASERLCEEAISQNGTFDPYRVEMTSAMTEEMFFTSFVEGAQIPLQEAMDFLARGTEPESIQEQMIWNNRHAWSEMVGGIYRPLDEAFVKGLAWMLTEEMDGCAEDYRQADNHPIAAMNDEPYDLPPAYSLPERMSQYYEFLRAPDTHPLIKAAVAQAYILVSRPFPEGNERLSRMMSAAVLLRCGYDFFRDISISSVIARENYRYYKAMCDILRPENGGDMTYFIEYYLELLTRALDDRKQRLLRREQDTLAREREMALQPLQTSEQPGAEPIANPPTAQIPLTASPPDDTESSTPERKKEGVSEEPLPLDLFLQQVDKIKHSPNPKARQTPGIIRSMLNSGMLSFTVQQWAEYTNQERANADSQCRYLYQRGLLDKDKTGPLMVYTFRVIMSGNASAERELIEAQADQSETDPEQEPESQRPPVNESPPIPEDLAIRLRSMATSPSETVKRSGEMIRELIDRKQYTFLRSEWAKLTGLSSDHACDACDHMLRLEVIRRIETDKKTAKYKINVDRPPQDEPLSQEVIDKITEMKNDSASSRDQRIGAFLQELVDQGKRRFSTADWEEAYHFSSSVIGHDLRRAVNLGLIRKLTAPSSGYQCLYMLCGHIEQYIRAEDMTPTQKQYLSRIYDAFPQAEFTVEDCGKVLHQSGSSASFHLNNFSTMGVITTHRHKGRAFTYTFAVTPTDNPEYFALTDPAEKAQIVATANALVRESESLAVAV